MKYYSIGYLFKADRDFVYSHLPVTHRVTTDLKEAEQWFNAAVERAQRSHFNELKYVKDTELDVFCRIKEACFICDEPAYISGSYIINLNCHSYDILA